MLCGLWRLKRKVLYTLIKLQIWSTIVVVFPLQKRLRQEHLAASYYIQAGESFSKFDPMQAVVVYRKAVLHMKNLGHYSVCANVS